DGALFPVAERLMTDGFNVIVPFVSRNRLIGGVISDLIDPVNFSISYEEWEKLSIMLENAYLRRSLSIEKWEKEILLKVSKKLSSSASPDEALNLIIDSLKKFVRYDSAAIFLIDFKDNTLKYQVIRGYDKEAFDKKPIKIGDGLVGWVIKTGKGIIVPDVSKDPRYINRRETTVSEMVVPIVSYKRILGAFNLESDKPHFFTRNQLETLKSFASQTAVILENARLYKDYLEKKHIKRELKIAREIQQVLLPKEKHNIGSYLIEAYNLPSEEIGGDIYDLVYLMDKKLGIAIGDISGKGIPGAILMASLYAHFKSQVRESIKTEKIIRNLNNSFYDITDHEKYATFFYGILDPSNDLFYYTNAGHNPPLLLRNNGDVEFLKEGGPVLGFLRDLNYKYSKKAIQKNDIIFMYTDGITECVNKKKEAFGEERLIDFLRKNNHLAPEKIKNKLLDEIKKYTSRKTFKDDITFVIIKKE
ncbi:hypothetical protein DRQ09_07370, partial [candidate division KSB1 bacterium]